MLLNILFFYMKFHLKITSNVASISPSLSNYANNLSFFFIGPNYFRLPVNIKSPGYKV